MDDIGRGSVQGNDRGRRRQVRLGLFAPLAAVATSGQVIAAPDRIGQTSPLGELADSIGPLDVVMIVLGVAALGLIIARRWYRLPSVKDPISGGDPGAALVCIAFAVMMFLAGPLGGAVVTRVAGPIETMTLPDHVRLGAGVYAAEALVAIAYFGLIRPRPRGDAWPPLRAAGLGGISLLVVWPVVQLVLILAAALTILGGGTIDRLAHDTLRMMRESGLSSWTVLAALQVVICAPLLEELLYRGLIQRAFAATAAGRTGAIIIASVVFASMHWSNSAPHAVAALFVLSLGFGWVYERTGRLAAPIAMHALFNLGNLVVAGVGN